MQSYIYCIYYIFHNYLFYTCISGKIVCAVRPGLATTQRLDLYTLQPVNEHAAHGEGEARGEKKEGKGGQRKRTFP